MASKTAFRRFAQAKDFVRKLTLKNQDEWNEYRKAGKRPLDIPSNPYYVYKKQWIGRGDWLGTGATSTHDRKYRSFREAREFARRLGLKNQNKWAIYAKSTKKPSDIPADPRAAYRKDWKGYGDWLGTGNLPPIKRVYRSFEDAKNYVHSLRLNNYVQWIEYRKSSKRPPDIPTSPNVIYRKDWKGYGDWSGTGTVASFNKIYRSFEKAKELSHSLDLKTQSQWSTYCKSGKKPDDIPSYPSVVYKKQWKDWGDWLGTGYIVYKGTSYLPFEEARGFAHRQGLHSVDDWRKYSKSGNRPTNIPSSPDIVYKNDWKGWGDWLGVENDVETNNQYRSFGEAREFVRSLCLKRRQWNEYCKSGKKPDDIPLFPDLVYKKYWKGSADWLGMKHVTAKGLTYKSFEDARKFVRTLELKNADEWNEYCKTGKKPDDIPSYPENKYKKEWGGVGDWLGTGAVASYNMKFLPFTDARLAVHKLQLKSGTEWHNYCKTDQKQKDIPSNPDKTYVKEWKGWGDWLGTGAIAPQDRQYRSFEEAREFVQLLDLRSQSEWAKYSKSDRKPDDIPAGPSRVYKKYWKGWGDWLGTGAIAPRNRQYRSFEQAREFAHILGLKSKEDWFNYSLSGKKPSDIPQKPDRVYKSQWKWWADWLGYEGEWNLKKIKELLRDLIASNIIYQWNEAVLYSFLLLKGVLNLTGNRHYQFFKNLIQAGHTDEGRKAIEDYANSDSEIPPDLSDFVTQKIQDPGEEIQAATTQELAQLADKKDPLDYGEIQSVEQILANTSVLESINVDEEGNAVLFDLFYRRIMEVCVQGRTGYYRQVNA